MGPGPGGPGGLTRGSAPWGAGVEGEVEVRDLPAQKARDRLASHLLRLVKLLSEGSVGVGLGQDVPVSVPGGQSEGRRSEGGGTRSRSRSEKK